MGRASGSSTGRAALRYSLSPDLGIEEFARSDNWDGVKPSQLEQVVVACDDRVGSGGQRAFQDAIVRLVLAHEADHLAGMDEHSEGADSVSRFPYPRRRPLELATEDPTDLVENGRGDTDLDEAGAPQDEDLIGRAAEVQR